MREVFFLPYVDPHMEIGSTAARVDAPLDELAGSISECLRQLAPQIVLTRGSNGEYGHPQRNFTHRATRLALAGLHSAAELWTWAAWYDNSERERLLNRYDRADVVRDITPWLEAKLAAGLCHRTQHTMFLRNSGVADVPAMIGRVESFRR
ncbi:MAG TPA: hypothetical protein VFX76_08155 [Roseiflexaceae bacterium]|nr:hypothetical protein [Roseiflexaceae bacterium]